MRRWAKLAAVSLALSGAVALSPTGAAAADPTCVGDGTSGKRVEAIYAHVTGQPVDPSATTLITQWSGEVDNVFDVSARKTAPGGFANPRWLFTLPCANGATALSVQQITIDDPGTDFDALRTELEQNIPGGLANLDRKYMVYMDTASCPGPRADFIPDTNPDPNANLSNQNPGTGFNRAMVAAFCHGTWDDAPNPGLFNRAPQHELIHLLGGVNRAAPNSGGGHCWDFWDAMCSDDTAPVGDGFVTDPDTGAVIPVPPTMGADVCTTDAEGVNFTLLLDCNNNDYFSMAPPNGNYLAHCWNTARSNFLSTSGVTPVIPNPSACALPGPPGGGGSGGGGGAAVPPPGGGFDLAAALKKCKKKKGKKAKRKCRSKAKKKAGAAIG
jgi:hypothetical protein